MSLRVHRQVGSLGEVLSEQAIGVLVGTALPRTLRIAEVHIDVGRQAKPPMIGLSFDTGINIFVGIGRWADFGDGDDMLVRSSENMIDLTEAELLWSGLTH